MGVIWALLIAIWCDLEPSGSAARIVRVLQHFGAFMRGSYVFYNTLGPVRFSAARIMRGSYVFYNALGPARFSAARIVRVLQHFGAFMRGSYVFYNTLGPGRIGGPSCADRTCFTTLWGPYVFLRRGSYVFYNTLEPSCADRTCFTTLWAPDASVVTPCPHAPVVDSVSYLLTAIRTL